MWPRLHLKNRVTLLGPSAVKWTTPDPCLGSSESDSKLYTNFEFCEEKFHRHSKKHIELQVKQFMMEKKIHEKSTYFKRRSKWCASRSYWTSDYLKICLKHSKITFNWWISTTVCDDDLIYKMKLKRMNTSNSIRSSNLHSKPYSIMCF